jgi:hypothetical protein
MSHSHSRDGRAVERTCSYQRRKGRNNELTGFLHCTVETSRELSVSKEHWRCRCLLLCFNRASVFGCLWRHPYTEPLVKCLRKAKHATALPCGPSFVGSCDSLALHSTVRTTSRLNRPRAESLERRKRGRGRKPVMETALRGCVSYLVGG